MSQQIKTRGIIIRKLNYAENDVIFEILTEEGQVVSFIAKGARKLKSKFSGVIQLGLVIEINYTNGKNLNYPSEIILDKENIFSFFTKSLAHMNFYTDVLTILRSVAKDLEDADVFNYSIEAFSKAQAGEDLVEIYNEFLINILEMIGVETQLRCYFSGQEIHEPEFLYIPESNKTFLSANKPQSIQAREQNFSLEFQKEYLQKLIFEHIHHKINLRF